MDDDDDADASRLLSSFSFSTALAPQVSRIEDKNSRSQ
jgi:hypothetical protein